MSDEVETSEEVVEAEEGEEGAVAPKKSRKMLFIIGGVVGLVLLLGGGAAYFFLFMQPGPDAAALAAAKPVVTYDLPTMTVNLNGNKDEFLKLSVSLELADETMKELIVPRIGRVVDAFQVYLRELRKSDLEGSAGIYRLKEELRRRVNLAIYPAEISGILFREILVQ